MISGTELLKHRHKWDYLWEPIFERLENGSITSVLNIGGGPSLEWIDLVKKYGIRLHVVDEYEGHGSSAQNLDALERIISEEGLRDLVSYEKCDVVKWNCSSRDFDLLYARNSLHHIIPHDNDSGKKLSLLFAKFHDITKDKGFFYIREVGRINYLKHFKRMLPKSMREIHYESKTNVEEYTGCLGAAGFSVEEIKYYVPAKLKHFRPFLSNKFANVFLTSAFMILAVKR
ncbi:MAG: class I SAM-dependent methyltransferase [bacterium]